MREGTLESIRRAEIEILRPFFTPGSRVLEIGGGSGYQARQIKEWGCSIFSIDLASRPLAVRYHPVVSYDGTNIPAQSNSFDIIFSSNVLEHVGNLAELFAEVRRVARPDAVIVHVLPSVWWRIWTSVAHYAFLVKALAGVRDAVPGIDIGSIPDRAKRQGALHLIRRALIAGPHGAYPSAFAEVYYFGARRWKRVFEENGFDVEKISPSGIYNSGYVILRSLDLERRRKLSKLLGSSTNIFVMRKRRPRDKVD